MGNSNISWLTEVAVTLVTFVHLCERRSFKTCIQLYSENNLRLKGYLRNWSNKPRDPAKADLESSLILEVLFVAAK